ncbi:MAG: hypothetical protein ACM3NH_05020 [Candidatus Saccharibacteria bacterium]
MSRNRFLKFIALILPVLMLGMFSFGLPARAQALVIVTQMEPLFTEANFAPGEQVTRWVKIANQSDNDRQAGLLLFNLVDPGHLGDAISLSVSSNGTELFRKTLSELSSQQETSLGIVAGKETRQYDLTATMDQTAGNGVQGQTLSFDITFGLSDRQEEEVHTFGGGGGGVVLIPNNPNPPAPPEPGNPEEPGIVAGETTENPLPPQGPGHIPKPGEPAGFFIPRVLAAETETDTPDLGETAGTLFTDQPGSGQAWFIFSWWGWLSLLLLLLLVTWFMMARRLRKRRTGDSVPHDQDFGK